MELVEGDNTSTVSLSDVDSTNEANDSETVENEPRKDAEVSTKESTQENNTSNQEMMAEAPISDEEYGSASNWDEGIKQNGYGDNDDSFYAARNGRRKPTRPFIRPSKTTLIIRT